MHRTRESGKFSRRASPSSELPQPELARLRKTIPITGLTFCESGISDDKG